MRAQSCPTLCDPVDCSLPGSPVPGILQARILEWVAMPSCEYCREHSAWVKAQKQEGAQNVGGAERGAAAAGTQELGKKGFRG